MQSASLRLKIELNTIAKFYLKVSEKGTLLDLKKLIATVLKKNYGISLKSFSLRSVDGFEILDIFRVGDILEHNQLVIIDPFTHAIEMAERKIEYGEYVVPENSKEKLKTSSSKIKKDTLSDVYMKNNEEYSKSEQLKTLSRDLPILDMSLQKPRVELPSAEKVTVKDINIEKRSITAPGEAVKLKENANLPPKPDNFKGFVIKKTDIPRTPDSNLEETCFKPLKKRKMEEEFEDL